ncbi:hypothetical protein [Streptomyces sp. NPDC058045]|uniref:hypothetical protein n=1 Tax=Streptomyces sp. NPDC058045 TaxID=3346311 RepID=UPI0036EE9096
MDQTNATAPARRVEITTRGGRADIEIDGRSIEPSAVKAYSVSHLAGEHPEVLLHVADRNDTQWSGIARVAVADLPPLARPRPCSSTPSTRRRWRAPRFPVPTSARSRTP